MFYTKHKSVKLVLSLLTGLVAHSALANNIVVEAGAFNASQGNSQNISIKDLIGNQYTVSHHYDQNMLLGIGYYFNGLNREKYNLEYGVNIFYFAPTTVEGDVIQEQMFDNLSYRYNITNIPIYLATKAFIKISDKYDLTLDFGAGPNIITTSGFSERSVDGDITVPDPDFSGKTTVALSAMAGIGLHINNVFGHLPLEIGYRFFYLGQGSLVKPNNQFADTLNTGNNYANALMISTSF